MRKCRHYIAVLAVASLAIAGCNKFENFGWLTGDAIRFGAGTQGNALTKTAYGDIYSTIPAPNDKDADGKRKQMVNWTSTDIIRIACAQASTTEEGTSTSADYKTTPTGVTTNSSKSGRHESRATLSLPSSTAKGLRWGSETAEHTFYAVCPSPATEGKSADNLTDGGLLTGSIPVRQSGLPVSSSGVAAVDMNNLYLVAKKTIKKEDFDNSEVFLYFTPITTVIEFEVTNGMTGPLAIKSIDISSNSEYEHLSGKFKTDLSTIPVANEDGFYYPAVTANGDNSNTTSVTFGNTGHTLAVGQKLTFTIFLLPEDNLADLTFRINKTDGTYIKTALKQVLEGSTTPTFIEFARCKKHFVKGLFVNEGAKWTLCFTPDVSSWKENTDARDLEDPLASSSPYLVSWTQGESGQLSLGEPVEYKFSLASGVSDTQAFSDPTASNWNVKTLGVTSTKDSDTEGWVNEPQGWKIKTVDGNAVTGDGTSCEITDKLKVEKSGTNLVITDKRPLIDYGDNDHWTDSNDNLWYKADWSNSKAKSSSPMDLSKYDFQADDATTTMTTANCYIVRHAGTYKIPLVYGNGVVGGNTNINSYKPTIVTGGTNGLTPFVNHLGNGIFNPFIENNTDDGDAKWYTPPVYAGGSGNIKTPEAFNRFLVASSAKVLWQDNGEVIKNVRLGAAVSGHVSNTGNPVMCDKDHVRYIEFSISQNDIRQCNAVIAVYDGANGTGNILWSWHIWITNDPAISGSAIDVTNLTNKTYSFFPVPAIGYIEPPLYEQKNDVTIVLEQEESGNTTTVTVKQPEYRYEASATYYQFGRKDPMPRTDSPAVGIINKTSGPTTLANSILSPAKFYYRSESDRGDWCSTKYFNLWTGNVSTNQACDESDNMCKTIYDPSPAGYKVPAAKAFTGFTSDGSEQTDVTNFNVSGPYTNFSWNFYTQPNKQGGTINFPAIRYRGSTNGDIIGGPSPTGVYWTSVSSMDNGAFILNFFGTVVVPCKPNIAKPTAAPIRPVVEN